MDKWNGHKKVDIQMFLKLFQVLHSVALLRTALVPIFQSPNPNARQGTGADFGIYIHEDMIGEVNNGIYI